MIKLEINSQKQLTISKSTKVFKGENLINSIQVTAANPYIGDKRVSDCSFYLHAVLPDGSYIVYPVEWSQNSIPLTGFVPITADITSDAQILKLYIEIKSGAEVIGKSNKVNLQVYDSPNEVTSITPRGELEQTISELEEELESASTLTETLEALKGSYDSVAGRIAADETQISSNASNISTNQSAIVSLTAALSGKLNDLPSSVKTTNINDSAVTTAKIADESVTYAKLSTNLQGIVDAVPDTPVFVENKGTLSAGSALDSSDYCIVGGVYQFTIAGLLANAVGIGAAKPCELRYINGYQIITQTDTQQVFARQVTRVVPTFQAESWSEVINPAITSLGALVAEREVNDILEAALAGLTPATTEQLNNSLENTLNGGN